MIIFTLALTMERAMLPTICFHTGRGVAPKSAADAVGAPQSSREVFMNIHLTLGPIVSLIAGILILVMPRLLNYIVAIYLIIIGLLGLFGSGSFHLQ
jgi:DUF3096 family protein